jgi:hypothetical protein
LSAVANLRLRLLAARARWLSIRAAIALAYAALPILALAVAVHFGELWVYGACILASLAAFLLPASPRRRSDAPPAVSLGFDAESEIALRRVPGHHGILAPLLRVALAPRLRIEPRGLVLTDRRKERVIKWARIAHVDWTLDGLELTLVTGERMSLRTFSPPSNFLTADSGVAALVRAATFQAMALNQRLAERVKEAMRRCESTPYRTAARQSADAFRGEAGQDRGEAGQDRGEAGQDRGEAGQDRDGVPRVDAHVGGKHARIDDAEVAHVLALEAGADPAVQCASAHDQGAEETCGDGAEQERIGRSVEPRAQLRR